MEKIDISLFELRYQKALEAKEELLRKIVLEEKRGTFTDEEREKLKEMDAEILAAEEQLKHVQDLGKRQSAPASGPPDVDFREFGDFLQAVRYNPSDPALQFRESPKSSDKRVMSMGVGAAGGFIVPEQFSTIIKMVDAAAAIFRPRAQVIPAGDPPDAAITIPALDQSGARGVYSGVVVTWIAEGALKPETEPRLREIKLEPQEVAAHTILTDKLLRNSAAAGALVQSLLRKAIIGAEEDTFLTGTGVGQPLGIIGHPATIPVARTGPAAIVYADIVNMYASFKFGGRGAWIVSQTTLPQLMTMVAGVGGPLVWQPNAREGAPGSLIGMPVLINDQSPILGAQGDLALVDLDYYLIKDGSGIAVAMSEHPRFTQNQTIIKAYWNVDGQPWLNTPLLQRDGVTLVSPFVVLL